MENGAGEGNVNSSVGDGVLRVDVDIFAREGEKAGN